MQNDNLVQSDNHAQNENSNNIDAEVSENYWVDMDLDSAEEKKFSDSYWNTN